MVLLLREVAELVSAPQCIHEHISFANDKTEEYIQLRVHCFAEKKA
jgi:hypothetical protein